MYGNGNAITSGSTANLGAIPMPSAPVAPIPGAIEAIGNEVDMLRQTIGELHRRLAPVLGPVKVDVNAAGQPSTRPPTMTAQLHDIGRAVSVARAGLVELLDRLEL